MCLERVNHPPHLVVNIRCQCLGLKLILVCLLAEILPLLKKKGKCHKSVVFAVNTYGVVDFRFHEWFNERFDEIDKGRNV